LITISVYAQLPSVRSFTAVYVKTDVADQRLCRSCSPVANCGLALRRMQICSLKSAPQHIVGCMR